DVLQRHCRLLQSLDIRLDTSLSIVPFSDTEELMSRLQSLSIDSRSNSVCERFTLLPLLRRSPNLVNLSIYSLNIGIPGGDEVGPIVLPRLRRLEVCNDSGPDRGCDKIFQMVTAPGLESLDFAHMPKLLDDLVSFLERSSPPLTKLALGCTQIRMEPHIELLDEFLSAVPTLTRLDIMYPAVQFIEQLSTILMRTRPSRAVPNLQILEFQLAPRDRHSASSWNVLLPALVARRDEIQSIRIRVHSGSLWDEPEAVEDFVSPRALSALKELAADGMAVWVGPFGENLFSL
ncbi:hypothetical protein FB45DRAFT_1135654, partial [Roridomyces roridus]